MSASAGGDKWARFSNYGNPPIDFAELGVPIKSTCLSDGYNTIGGTSMVRRTRRACCWLARRAGGKVAGDPDGDPDVIGVDYAPGAIGRRLAALRAAFCYSNSTIT